MECKVFHLTFLLYQKIFFDAKIFAKIFIDFLKNKVYYNNEGGLS